MLTHLALQIIPAPVLSIATLLGFRALTWSRGLTLTAGTAVLVTWLRLRFLDFGMACLGAACEGNWVLRGYLAIYAVAVTGGLIVALILIPVALRFRRKDDADAAPA